VIEEQRVLSAKLGKALGVVLDGSAVAVVFRRVRSACSRRAVCFAVPLMGLLLLGLATWGLAHHIYFDRSGVPDLEP